MGYPNIIFGRYGDEKFTQSTTFGIPLGGLMILPDGRTYVHSKASSAAALSLGCPVVQKDSDTLAGSADNLAVATNAAIGATTVVITMPAGTTVATVVDQFAGGYLFATNDTGQGYTYKIKSSNSAAAASTATFILEPTDPIVIALATGTSDVTVRENQYYDVLDRAAATGSVGAPAGVPQAAVSAGYYCWLLRRGEGTFLSAGTVVVQGRPFACATTVAGFQAWHPTPAAGSTEGGTTLSPVAEAWGYCSVPPSASTEYFAGILTLV